MTKQHPMKIINPAEALSDETKRQIADLAIRQDKARGILMSAVTFAGGQVEDGLSLLPKEARAKLEAAARRALLQSYDTAEKVRMPGPLNSDRGHKVLASLSGALGGVGGLPTALVELPIATTVIFRAVQNVAESYGEDPTSEETRLECLRVFGSGGPGDEDDGIDTSFVGARMSLTGPALNKMINVIAPRFATVLGQKLATQAVPIIGAAAGAGTNYVFVDYYVEMAHVHFGLRALTRNHDADDVAEHFHKVLNARKISVNLG